MARGDRTGPDPPDPAPPVRAPARPSAGRSVPPRVPDRDRPRDVDLDRARAPFRSGPPATAADRLVDAVEIVAVYGVVSERALLRHAYPGSHVAARRAIAGLVNDGVLERHRSSGSRYSYSLYSVTPDGLGWLRGARERRDKRGRGSLRFDDPDQVFVARSPDARQLLHDQRVFEAVAEDVRPDLESGSRVKRVRLDVELRSLLASASESARPVTGHVGAGRARRAVAEGLGLRSAPGGSIPLPDALVEIQHPDGRVEVRGIEVGTAAYTKTQIAAKIAAGFRFYMPAGRSAPVRTLAASGR